MWSKKSWIGGGWRRISVWKDRKGLVRGDIEDSGYAFGHSPRSLSEGDQRLWGRNILSQGVE